MTTPEHIDNLPKELLIMFMKKTTDTLIEEAVAADQTAYVAIHEGWRPIEQIESAAQKVDYRLQAILGACGTS